MARQAGMPRERVAACADDEKNLAAVDANWQEGQTRYNVGSTPTFIINGTTHVGEISFDAVETSHRPAGRRMICRESGSIRTRTL